MKLTLPITVLQTMQKFQDVGAEIYIVGGAVRDILSGVAVDPDKIGVDDWDFTTNLVPEEIIKLFPENSFYDNQFGTVGVKIQSGNISLDPRLRGDDHSTIRENPLEIRENPVQHEIYEITTFRTESSYSDKRRPDKVEWGKTLQEDLKRRDFTINAMAMRIVDSHGFRTDDFHGTDNTDLNQCNQLNPFRENPSVLIRENPGAKKQYDQLEIDVEIIDKFNGQEDLKNRLVKCVGDANERFHEDALRMMRAVRISTELGFQIEPKTFEAIKNDHVLLKEIATERITEELRKILASQFPVEGIKFLQTTGILGLLIPELLQGYGMAQKGHHIYDVYTHALEALRYSDNSNWAVRFAALLHDVGKPVTARGEGETRTFYNHEIVGAKIAFSVARRLKLSKMETDKLVTLVRWHMFSVSEFLTDAAIRRFIRRVGKENIEDMMDVRIADRLGSGCTKAESWRLRDFKARIIEVQKHTPSVRDLKVNGEDVMKILKIKPGPQVGKILNELFEEIMEDVSKNEREYLLKRIKEIS